MHVISKKRLAEFWAIHSPSRGPLNTWHTVVEHAQWSCFDDVRRTYNSADAVNGYVVFNVNSYRIITTVRYPHRVYIDKVLTHAEYDKWKP
jgi:mRNA interferase HigB